MTTLDGQQMRALDFDPAPGGVEGQLIEVDLEGCTWRVVAPSFPAFLHGYADDLERGVYVVTDEGIEPAARCEDGPLAQTTMPAYLRDVVIEHYDPSITRAIDDTTQEGVLSGSMGMLLGMGRSRTLFSLHVSGLDEQRIVATAECTRGYNAIRSQQYARVRVTRYTGQLEAEGTGSAEDSAVQWLALEYIPLR